MKKIKLTEDELTKIISKVIKEQEKEERACPCDTGPPHPDCCPDMDEWMNDYSQDGRCYPVKALYNEMGYKYNEDNDHHDYEKRMEGGGWFYLRHYCRWNVERGHSEKCVPTPIVQSMKINSDGCDVLLFWEDEMSPINLGQGDEMINRLNAWETAYQS